jgi:hypothetical protein
MSALPHPRPVDHVVLPVAELAMARGRLGRLGFTVAPTGVHPFGTENACVYLADGTFLEPLAIRSRETAEAAAVAGNAFVARDAAYRFRCGADGFSALVMGSDDARADDRQFHEAGLSGGNILDFGRDFVAADGSARRMDFRLAFAADLRSPDAFFFTCQRINPPPVDRSALSAHANGAIGIRAVVMAEDNPTDFQYLLQLVAGRRDDEAHSFGMDIEAANATLSVMTPAGLAAHFGAVAPSGRGLRLMGLVFTVADLAATARVLDENVVAHATKLGRIVVPHMPGQGAFFAFEASR